MEQKKSLTFLLSVMLMISATTPVLASHVEIYSETTTDSRTKNAVAFNRLHWQFSDYHLMGRPGMAYLGTGFTKDEKSQGDVIYNDNNAFLSAGVSWSLTNFLSSFVEYRNIVDELGNKTVKSKNDYRAGFSLFYRDDSTSSLAFNEHYSEMVFSNRQARDIFWMGRSRFGYAKNLSGPVVGEVMVQGKAKMDRLGHYYENLVEVGPAARLRWLKRNYSVDLLASYSRGQYLGREYVDPMPINKNYANASGLLVFYGSF